MQLTDRELLMHLRRILAGVMSGDTVSGAIEFDVVDRQFWEVKGSYRVGYLQEEDNLVVIDVV